MSRVAIDFLGIGAQRAATTWLDRSLRRHPGIWLPPHKELHYFDRMTRFAPPGHLACQSIWQGISGSRPQDRAWRWHLTSMTFQLWRRRGLSLADLAWLARYHFLFPKDDAWYRSLFAGAAGRITGEITPAYGLLDETEIARIKHLFPDVRVIFIMRDPIDRALSQLTMHQASGLLPAHADAGTMLGFLLSPTVTARGDYAGMLRRWRSCFPKERLFVGWYDDIRDRPERVIAQVCDFLGTGVMPGGTGIVARGRETNQLPRAVPAQVIEGLAAALRPQLAALADNEGGHAVEWLARCDALLR